MGEIKRLLFFPSRWLRLAVFLLAGRLLALCDGVLHSFIVEAVGFEHQLFRVQEFRLKPCPCRLFGRHAMIFEEAASREGSGSKDAHPAHICAADKWAQAEIDADCHAHSQQGTDKLPDGESKKDGLLIIPDFLWYFNFDKKSAPSKNRLYFSYF